MRRWVVGSSPWRRPSPPALEFQMHKKDDSTDIAFQTLDVIRITRGEACLMGRVRIRAGNDAYVKARALADTAPGFTCGRDEPRVDDDTGM